MGDLETIPAPAKIALRALPSHLQFPEVPFTTLVFQPATSQQKN
jgi:hypothetical protein